ncbi:MAG: efflux RND transporter periplasmic adaptor subunit [Candidatus Eisenbacteria bacterium]|nr:efflux RND transporter periplasmic adaptor subunit [Candidatus Eisenbacteria bacterium]MCC7141008.1 efflux RND transporter periplasmic adaptor subunit [Candidatus Eisenbacteria bacterium]
MTRSRSAGIRLLAQSLWCLLLSSLPFALSSAPPLLVSGCGSREAQSSKYYCPMHPTYVSDRMGDCPICNMRLVPIPESKSQGDEHSAAEHSDVHPAVRDSAGFEAMGHAPAGTRLMPVELTLDELNLAGVATVPVTRGSFDTSVRAVGIVQPDERRIRSVSAKASGYVERLFVNTNGQSVRAGEPILALFSPELLAAQEEFANALRGAARLRESSLPEARDSAERLLAAARRRLELLDVPPARLSELDAGAAPERTVTLLAPVSGFVLAKDVVQGTRIEPGMPLYTVTDLSRVWVEAAIQERDLPRVQLGLVGTLSSASLSAPISSEVSYISPVLDAETRTAVARLELDNAGLRLKPGMFLDVALASSGEAGLSIPTDAILDTGSRKLVYVHAGGTRFEPREVTIGRRTNQRAEIVHGVLEGEMVVIRATFLLDSESRIRAGVAGH